MEFNSVCEPSQFRAALNAMALYRVPVRQRDTEITESHACSPSTSMQTGKNGSQAWNTFFQGDKRPSQPVLDLPPCVGILFCCTLSVHSFVLLTFVCLMFPGQPHCCICPCGKRWSLSAPANEGCMPANSPASAARGIPWPWGACGH